MSFLSSLASLVEFLNEEKSSLLKPVEWLKQTETVERANFIHAAIYSFSSKHNFKPFSHVAMDAYSSQSVNIQEIFNAYCYDI